MLEFVGELGGGVVFAWFIDEEVWGVVEVCDGGEVAD